MNNPYSILGIEDGASREQIQAAYNKKRARLLASLDNNPDATEEIQKIDEALVQLLNQSNLALTQTLPPQPSGSTDSILSLVDKLDAPILDKNEAAYCQPCPYCGIPNPVHASVCSSCGRQISRPCPKCGHRVLLNEAVCPRCNTIISELDQQRHADAVITKGRVEEERLKDQMRVEALEDSHRKRASFGILLWTGIILAILGVCAAGLYALYYFANQ